MTRLWIVATSFVLAACTPIDWTKPGANPEQVAADSQQCGQEAYRQASYLYPGYTAFGPTAFGRHFVSRPAGAFFDPYSDRRLEETRIANFCMRAKGYDLAPVSK